MRIIVIQTIIILKENGCNVIIGKWALKLH